MSNLVQLVPLGLFMLLTASLVAIAVRRVRIPYTVALVLVGLVLSLRPPLKVDLTPELILSIFLPPLVFEAAFHLNLRELRRNWVTIALLAVPGVVFTMLIVGGILSLGARLPLGLAFVFGSLIAATDPVSVVAIFRKFGAPKRLEVLLESESLFNDGTAIVIFGIALGAFQTGQFSFVDGVIDFALIGGGGVVVGFVIGWVVLQLIDRIDDYLVETTLTTLAAYGSYLVAETLGVSQVPAGLLPQSVRLSRLPPGLGALRAAPSDQRERLAASALESDLADPRSRGREIFAGLNHLIDVRRSSAAFHLQATERVLDFGRSIFAAQRESLGDGRGSCGTEPGAGLFTSS